MSEVYIYLKNDILTIDIDDNGEYYFNIDKLEYFYFILVRKDFYFLKFKILSTEININIESELEKDHICGYSVWERLNKFKDSLEKKGNYNESFLIYKEKNNE